MLIYLIQKTNDTLTPLRNLPTKGNIGEDRETLLFQYRENNKIMQEKRKERLKTKIVLSPKMPISPALMSDFKEEVVKVKPDWVESVDELRKVDWQRDTLKILFGKNEECQKLRDYVILMFRGTGQGATRYSYLHHILRRIESSKKTVLLEDRDCLYQVFL